MQVGYEQPPAVCHQAHIKLRGADAFSGCWSRELCLPCCIGHSRSGADGSIEQLAVGNRAGGWQLSAFHAAPEFDDATPHDKLALGKL